MKRLVTLACIGVAVAVSTPVFAGAQQDKMKGCSAEAKAGNLQGADRKAFMSKCLKKDYVLKSAAPSSAKGTQQDKMKSCNADAKAKALKGDERKKFMSSCLKG